WKQLDTEINHIKERLKAAMQAQEISETSGFQLSSSTRSTKKVEFGQLAKLTQMLGIELDLPIQLTQKLQKELGELIEQLPVEEETSTSLRLSIKEQNEEELPF
ncbi:MAG: ribonuclease D, partial [Coleofasciculus sp. S288]|nr:ribonuclease D [Coleofasciculus sp. S288]